MEYSEASLAALEAYITTPEGERTCRINLAVEPYRTMVRDLNSGKTVALTVEVEKSPETPKKRAKKQEPKVADVDDKIVFGVGEEIKVIDKDSENAP